MQTRVATCACGQLRAICEGEPQRIGLCSCIQCQKRSGSAFSVNSCFGRNQVKVEAKKFTRGSDAGRTLDFFFCPECGSTVCWTNSALPDVITVAVGTFGDPAFPAPQRAVWTQHKHRWVALPEGCISGDEQEGQQGEQD